MTLEDLSDLAEISVARKLSQINGVSEVNVYGQRKPALRVQASPERLAALGITFADVRQVLQAASVNQAKGAIYGRDRVSTLATNDQIFAPKDYGALIITYHDGAPVFLRDVAKIAIGAENEFVGSWQNGKPGMYIMIRRQPGANIVSTAEAVRAALPAIRQQLPASVTLEVLNDRTRTIRSSLHEVEVTLAVTFVLVIIVMGVFLRQLSATAIVACVLAVALIATIAAMYVLGFSLNNLTLVALVVAVGFVVDDAIVVVENIHRHLEAGASMRTAALQGASEIGGTVMSISLFAGRGVHPAAADGWRRRPVVPGVRGNAHRSDPVLSGDFADARADARVTLHEAVRASCARQAQLLRSDARRLRARPRLGSRPSAHDARGIRAHHRRRGRELRVRAEGILPAAGHRLHSRLIARCRRRVVRRHARQASGAREDPGEGAFDLGADARRRRHRAKSQSREWPLLRRAQGPYRTAIFRQTSSSRSCARRSITSPASIWSCALNQDINLGGRGSRSQYTYVLSGGDSAQLGEWAGRLTEKLQSLPQFRDVSNEMQLGAAVRKLTIDRIAAARYGFRAEDVDQVLYDAYGQRQIGEYQNEVNQYRIVLEVDPRQRGRIDTLQYFYPRSPRTGQMVPLSSFARIEPPGIGPLSITHDGMFPVRNDLLHPANRRRGSADAIKLGAATRRPSSACRRP